MLGPCLIFLQTGRRIEAPEQEELPCSEEEGIPSHILEWNWDKRKYLIPRNSGHPHSRLEWNWDKRYLIPRNSGHPHSRLEWNWDKRKYLIPRNSGHPHSRLEWNQKQMALHASTQNLDCTAEFLVRKHAGMDLQEPAPANDTICRGWFLHFSTSHFIVRS